MGYFRSADMRKLLHNKFVVVLGDSIQRSVYKDLVKLLQVDELLTYDELRLRGEITFLNDTLVEGGERDGMHNGTTYREVRQHRTGHHLVRLYFVTRVYSTYLESILSDFKSGPQPDVVIVSSCIWDLMRYNDKYLEAYKTNLDLLFQRLKEVLSPQCLIIWNMTMPVGVKYEENPQYTAHSRRQDIVEGNFFSATLADFHKLDVLDMHYHFRFDLRFRCSDAVHWNMLAHRKYTQILLTHIAQAWGVKMPKTKIQKGKMLNGPFPHDVPPHLFAFREDPYPNLPLPIQERCSQGRIPLLPAPNELVMGSPYTEQRMMSPGATLWQPPTVPSFDSPGPPDMPGYISFNGSDIDPMPGPPVCAVPPHSVAFREDPNLHPPIPEREHRSPGPGFTTPPFAGRTFPFPNMQSFMNFTPFPLHDPYPQENWNTKMMSRRALRPRGGWMHPYPRPLMYLPGID